MSKLLLALYITALAGVFAQPSPPVWANQWQANFSEEYNAGIFHKVNVTGAYYYDWTNSNGREDRSNGQYDAFCSSVEPGVNTPCTHYIVNGSRYLSYPELNYCCNCCTYDEGCGLLKNDWLSDATYDGQTTIDNTLLDVWEKMGGSMNYYYQTQDGRPFMIKDGPSATFYFDLSTYQTTIVDPSVFNLPSLCSSAPLCADNTICGAVRLQALLKEDIIQF